MRLMYSMHRYYVHSINDVSDIYVYVYAPQGFYTAAMYVFVYVSVYAYDRLVGISTGL